MWLHAEQGARGQVIDLDTGLPVRKVIRLNEEAGLLEAYQVDAHGKERQDGEGNFLTVTLKGRFKFIPRREAFTAVPKIVMGAPACAKCGCNLTLRGDDLCPTCRAKDRGQRNPMTRGGQRLSPLEIRWCDHKGCSRRAAWAVGDEVTVTPELARRGRRRWLFDRAMTVGVRHYCSFHFQPPRILDAKGEVIEELHEAGGVRPQ